MFGAIAAITSSLLSAQVAASCGVGPSTTALEIYVPNAPTLSRQEATNVLRYELRLSNLSDSSLNLRRIVALDPLTGRPVLSLEGDRLRSTLVTFGRESAGETIDPGEVVFVALDVVWADPAAPPAALHHRIMLGASDDCPAVIEGGSTVPQSVRPTLGAPLRGGPWAAVYDPGLARGHRRVAYVVDGVARIPGRHAIDWMWAGGGSGRGRGSEVLAVAAGVIVATRDGVGDRPSPGQSPGASEGAGNFIALDIGDGRFVFYEHLQAGLSVRPGDRVVRGQVIARLGSSGQADTPHLHFHVADRPSPLGAEGLPYDLGAFTLLGRYRDVFDAEAGRDWTPGGRDEPFASGFPGPNAVVRFSD